MGEPRESAKLLPKPLSHEPSQTLMLRANCWIKNCINSNGTTLSSDASFSGSIPGLTRQVICLHLTLLHACSTVIQSTICIPNAIKPYKSSGGGALLSPLLCSSGQQSLFYTPSQFSSEPKLSFPCALILSILLNLIIFSFTSSSSVSCLQTIHHGRCHCSRYPFFSL